MAHSNGVISAPISASDPYQVLGVGIYAGGYDVGYICSNQHKRINKWAKYKPIDYPAIGELTEAQLKNGDYGIKPVTAKSTVLDAVNANSYEYVPPKGGDNSPYRLCDFIGYNHAAEPPILFSTAETIFEWDTSVQEVYAFQVMCYKNAADSLNLIQANSLLENMYLALAILASSNKYYVKTSAITLKQFIDRTEDPYVNLHRDDAPLMNFNSGSKVEYYLLASSFKADQAFVLETSQPSASFIPLPFGDTWQQKGEFTLKKVDNVPLFSLVEIAFGSYSYQDYQTIGTITIGPGTFRFRFKVKNQRSTAFSMTANEYQINVRCNGTYYFQSYEQVAINVPAGGTAEYEVQSDTLYSRIFNGVVYGTMTIEMTYQNNAILYQKEIRVYNQ